MTGPDSNPYATLADFTIGPPVFEPKGLFRAGKFLYLQDGAALLELCLITNQETGVGDWRKKMKIAWTPPWVFLFVLTGVLVALIMMVFAQKKAKNHLQFVSSGPQADSSQAVDRFRVATPWYRFDARDGEYGSGWRYFRNLFFAAVISILVSLVLLSVASPVKVAGHKNGWFKLKGCSPQFLDSLETFRD